MFKFLFRFMGSWVTPPLPIDNGAEPQLPSDLLPMTTQPVSSSPSSSSFTHDSSWTYDVFLSFRGEDTRTNFTDHLYKALCDKSIYTFIDRELTRGEEISPALVKAIEESRISLIVFSENYASSRWCLDELFKILQCKQSNQQIVLPIFYKVDPSDVRNQTHSFGDAFKGLIERKFKNDKEKVRKWKEALRQAANLSGHTFKDGEYEVTFINNIVDGILSQVLSRTYLNVAKYPVGIQSHVQDVKKLLDVGGNGRHKVGIWGASRIGKTTIAKAIWNAIAHKFEGSCFLPNVREGSLVQLQETLLDKILGKNWKIQSVDEGIGVIKERLRHKKILLILDDVNQLEQLDNLAGVGWFGKGSRVIITTQDSGLLKCHGLELIYKVQKLCDYQALELFSLNAFGINEPPNEYLELAQRAIAYAQGLPLAITLLGSHLRNKGVHRWQAILDDYKGEPYTHIERILQNSYDALDDDAKEVFLNIACFFKGEYKDYVLQIVPKKFIEEFVDKALITIEWSKILMHDLLANLGTNIVRKESPNDPGQRSRLWFYEDVKQVLMESTGTRNIKGIMVRLPEPAEITLNPECFHNMVNLQIFINCNASLCGDITYLPNALRWIDWHGYQLQSLPPYFLGKLLVVFNMPRSHIRQLEGFKHLPNLTSMNLRGCQFLEKIPDLSGIPNIKYLILSECTRLVEVDGSVGFLNKLVELDLNGCVKLTRCGTRLRLKSLEELYLRDCKRLESFPEIEVEMESLWRLDMQGSGVRELPPSIAYLTGLRHLDLDGCFNLTRFATLRLKSLELLSLIDCKMLESFPEIEVEMESLRKLDISGSGVRELPSSIAYLTGLRELHLSGCFNLTKFATLRLKSLVELVLRDCKRLESFPEIEVEMESLWKLDISGSGVRELPSSIAYLTGLRELHLSGCFNLTRFGTAFRLKSLGELVLRDCKMLESFPEIEVEMESLWKLDISGSGVRELPSSIAYLTGLRELHLSGCFNLTRFGTAFRLKSLGELVLRDCKMLESFPEIEVEMESLWKLDISGSGVRELPSSIAYLTGLQELHLSGCFNLTKFATLRLKSLRELVLRDCKRLESFPEIEVEMESLRKLDISGSGVRELPSSIAYLAGLVLLKADYCENLTITVNSQVSSSNSELQLLPNQSEFSLIGCNLSKSDFLLPLDCWSTLTELNLSGNNFVNLPICFSKFVNLRELDLSDCNSLREIPEQVLPPRIREIWLDNCTSLEKIPKLAWVLLDNCTSLEEIPEFSPWDDGMHLSLVNCVRLRGYNITENIFLNQVSVSHPHSRFDIVLPGDEVPKWFSCPKDATLVSNAGCEVSFEIPPNLKWETLRLVLCAVTCCDAKILVNGKLVKERRILVLESHVLLTCIPLLDMYELGEPLTWLKQGTNMCQVIFDSTAIDEVIFHLLGRGVVKMPCGVHLLGHQVADVRETDVFYHGPTQSLLPDAMSMDDDIDDDQHQDNELLSLPSASETSLGKRRRLSDFMALDDDHRANVVDVGDHEAQWLTLFTRPADHPKRRHIDLNEETKQ